MEVWKKVCGFEGFYEVSSMGRVRSLRSRGVPGCGSLPRSDESLLRPANSQDGYKLCRLYGSEGRPKMCRVHVLVLTAFVCSRPAGQIAGHLNANRADNRVENLAWMTPQENLNQRTVDGHTARGARHGRAKINAEQAVEIRAKRGFETQASLAQRFGISKTAISFIQSGRTWSHIK